MTQQLRAEPKIQGNVRTQRAVHSDLEPGDDQTEQFRKDQFIQQK